jgi:tetratricopeptide (TPR) repeat protein
MSAKSRRQRFRELNAVVDQGLTASTIKLAEQYLRDFPRHGWVWLDYGNALVAFARYAEARAAILRAIKLLPAERLDLPYSYMGSLYERKGEYLKAVEWYEKAAKVAPDDATYLIFMGGMLARAGRYSEAKKCHRRATKCTKGAIDEAYYNLGAVLLAEGRYKEASACFEKAVELDSKYKIAKQALKDVRRVFEIKGTSNNDILRTRK